MSRIRAKSLCILAAALALSGCSAFPGPQDLESPYRKAMRTFAIEIAQRARSLEPGFIVVPQNGEELFTYGGDPDGEPAWTYLDAIDGIGREDLFFGYTGDGEPTPADVRERIASFLDLAEENGVEALVIDYCSAHADIDRSYSANSSRGYISFAAPSRELDVIPDYPPRPFGETESDITSLSDAANFLYLINPERFADRMEFLAALRGTDYDLLIIDFDLKERELNAEEVASLKRKADGGRRLVLCYLSIGEAEDYRSYWDPDWSDDPPDWLCKENPDWPGDYKVRYWDPGWQAIVFAVLDRIVASGFDGVYLDLIDAYEYFEE